MKTPSFILLFVLCLTCSCKPSWIVGKPAECREFYGLPSQQRQMAFKAFPLEKQFRVYKCGMDIEPPDIERAYDIAEGGEKIVPALVEQLRLEKDDYAKDNIIYIFEIMSERGKLKGRKDIADIIGQVVSGMRSVILKKVSQERLTRIEKYITDGVP